MNTSAALSSLFSYRVLPHS